MIEFVGGLPATETEILQARCVNIAFDLKLNPNVWANLHLAYQDYVKEYYILGNILGEENVMIRDRTIYARYFEYPKIGADEHENSGSVIKRFWHKFIGLFEGQY